MQEIIQRRESDIAKGFQERAKPLKEYEAIQEVLAPFAANYRTQGYNDVDAIRMWGTVAGELRRDPAGAIRSLIQAHGLTPEHILGRAPDSQSSQNSGYADLPPDHPIMQRLARMEQRDQSREQATETQHATTIASNIDKFAADPNHPHFNAVRVHMGALMQAGVAADMESAYEQAVHANPETRGKVQEAARVVAEAKRIADAKVAAEKARKASVGVRGSPPMSNGAVGQSGSRTVRQELEAAMVALS